MDLEIARTDHIHARVGYEHGPQVPDPRLGKGLKWTEPYERWWDRIIEARAAEGRPFLTINPEFGPPAYRLWTRAPASPSPTSGTSASG